MPMKYRDAFQKPQRAVRPAQDRQRFATSQLRALEVIDFRFIVANLMACAAKYAFQRA
jgi:hypothetical protein